MQCSSEPQQTEDTAMILLEQLEQELARVREQLRRLTREQVVLAEQITRLRTGAPTEVVCAALHAALGVPVELYCHGAGTSIRPAPDAGERSERSPAWVIDASR